MSSISNNEKDFVIKALQIGHRLDGRNLVDHRKINIKFGTQSGQVELDMGNTKFFSRVTADIVEPKVERPNEGFLKFKVDLSILGQSQQSGSFDVKKYQTELNKLLERIIKGSKVIDVESLCLVTSHHVWSINVDCILINNDGNLVDSCYLSAIIALLHFRRPYVEVYTPGQKAFQPLSIHHIPITFTFGFFNDAKIVTSDPSNIEEQVMEGRVTIAMNIYNDLCSIHKPGGAPLDSHIMPQLIQVCSYKVKDITNQLRQCLANPQDYQILASKYEGNISNQMDNEVETQLQKTKIY